MLKLEAIVKPMVVDEVVARLIKVGVHSISYSEVHAVKPELLSRNEEEGIAGESEKVEFFPRTKIEVILDKGHLAAIEEALADEVCTPMLGGAEVVVFRLKEGLRMMGDSKSDAKIEEI
jgi:nitrogen regulatory protein PII